MKFFVRLMLLAAAAQIAPFAANAQDNKMPRQLVMATDRAGGVAHTMGSAFVSIITKYSGTKATVTPVGNPSRWVPMAKTGEVDLGMTGLVNMSWTYWGTGPRKGAPEKFIRVLAVGAAAHWGFLVPADSGVKTLAELKKWLPGKRLTHHWINPAVDSLNLAYLANLGYSSLKDAKLTAVPVSSYSVFTSLWNQDRVDVVGMPVGIPLVQQMFAARKGRFMPVYDNPAAVARLQAKEPAYYVSEQKRKVLGVDHEMPMLAYDYALAARTTLSDGAVKKILETLWDHQNELAQMHPLLRGWLPAKEKWASTNVTFPYHPGAVEFYKEKGVWTAALAKKQAQLIAKSKN